MQDVALPPRSGPHQGGQTQAHANIRAKLDPSTRKSNSSGVGRAQLDAAAALRSLLDTYGKTDVDGGWRIKQLKALGNGKTYRAKSSKEGDVDKVHKSLATMFNNDDGMPQFLDTTGVKDSHQAEKSLLGGVCEVILQKTTNLQHLLARGSYQSTILHTILEPATYSQGSTSDTRGGLRFDRLKVLVKFLLWLQPELPTIMGAEGRATPLFFVIKSGPVKTHDEGADSLDESSETDSNAEEQQNPFLDETTKAEIVRFICDQNPEGQGRPTDPVRSLALLASQSEDGASAARHAVHAAIESDFTLPDDILARLQGIRVDFKADGSDKEEKTPCLEVPNRVGRTCLHLALTAPFTRNRIAWAKQLAKVQPGLLKLQYKHVRTGESDTKDKPIVDYMTPLQYLVEQRRLIGMNGHKDKTKVDSHKEVELLDKELDDLKEVLKCQCLGSFDHITCKAIMYTRQNEREVFLTLLDETISSEFLENQKRHYKLDTSLQSVHIANNNRIQWDDNKAWDDSIHKMARSWQCLGNTDLFMVFHWLKDTIGVKKVFEVVVDELAKSPGHSDTAIVECLKKLDVETWNWRRMDIPVNVIIDAAGDHVKSLYLYCSGLRAVLQSWSDTRGLVNLQHLERVEVEIHQGLESKECVKKFAEDFKHDMKKIHAERYKADIEKGLKSNLEVVCNPVYAASKRNPANNDTASKVKADGESGFEEQDWLKCMDEFAELMDNIETNPQSAKGRPVKVALIDDGVRTSYAWLDENVDCGRSGWGVGASATPKGGDKKKAAKNYPRNYNHSQTGHGTVMAYFIRRVCPWVKLCIAKLECQSSAGPAGSGNNQPVTFSIESATEAIKWAVSEKVDIISMSWAIDKSVESKQTGQLQTDQLQMGQLRDAITLAADHGILLFCANPDKNKPGTEEYKNNDTYPKALAPEKTLFCIGAATQEGKRWRQISKDDHSCEFFLPGVELVIPEENTMRKSQGEPPHGWYNHSGSSLSCALAAGLAAMILHCTLVSGLPSDDPRWKWLRSCHGMRRALQNISTERDDGNGLWLPVRRVFGEAAKTLDGPQKKMLDALRSSVVDELLKGAPRLSANGPAKDAEPAPGRLKKRATNKVGEY